MQALTGTPPAGVPNSELRRAVLRIPPLPRRAIMPRESTLSCPDTPEPPGPTSDMETALSSPPRLPNRRIHIPYREKGAPCRQRPPTTPERASSETPSEQMGLESRSSAIIRLSGSDLALERVPMVPTCDAHGAAEADDHRDDRDMWKLPKRSSPRVAESYRRAPNCPHVDPKLRKGCPTLACRDSIQIRPVLADVIFDQLRPKLAQLLRVLSLVCQRWHQIG